MVWKKFEENINEVKTILSRKKDSTFKIENYGNEWIAVYEWATIQLAALKKKTKKTDFQFLFWLYEYKISLQRVFSHILHCTTNTKV